MYRPKISIRAMLAIVAFIALACVALVRANAIWASLMFTAALTVISFAVLAAIFRRGAKQAFWIGFALFGWLYLWVAHWPNDYEGASGPNDSSRWRLQHNSTDILPTTQLLVHAYNEWLPMVRKPVPVPVPSGFAGPMPAGAFGGPAAGGGGFGTTDGGGLGTGAGIATPTLTVIDYPALHEFGRVGHSLFIVVVAFVGAFVATWLYKTRDQLSIGGRGSPSDPAISPPAPAA